MTPTAEPAPVVQEKKPAEQWKDQQTGEFIKFPKVEFARLYIALVRDRTFGWTGMAAVSRIGKALGYDTNARQMEFHERMKRLFEGGPE